MNEKLIDEIIEAVLTELDTATREGVAHASRRIVDHGSAHIVVLLGTEAAIRIARDADAGSLMERRQAMVDSLPPLGFTLPRSLSPVVTCNGTSAVGVVVVPGSPAPAGPVNPAELARLLGALHEVDIEPLRPVLASPLDFCGGEKWYRVHCEQVIPLLPESVREKAAQAVDALNALAPEEPTVLSHGDLGGSNVHWREGRVSGVLDWDLASASDRSTDIATLALWHGEQSLSLVARPVDLQRARIRQRTFPLQQVAFSLLAERPQREIDEMLTRAEAALLREDQHT